MPIVIQLPGSTDPFGVGFTVIATAPAGPFPADTVWIMRVIQQEPGTQTEASWETPWTGSSTLNTIAGRPPQTLQIPQMSNTVKPNAPARLVVDLHSPSLGLQDTGETAITYDPTSGAPFILQERLRLMEQANTSLDVKLGEVTQLGMMALPPAALIPIASGAAGLVLSQPKRTQIVPDRTGEGELEPTPPLAKLGIGFDVIEVPPYIGTIIGNPDRYSRTILNLVIVKQAVSGFEYLENIYDFDVGAQYVRFLPTQLVRVQYAIPPGVVIRFYWLEVL